MRRLLSFASIFCLFAFPALAAGQEEAPDVDLPPLGPPPPTAYFDQPPTLPPVAPRMPVWPAFPPPADPRVIFFDPYFFPTHYNFRPLPYGLAPTDPGFFYGAYANPYYYPYYGPGAYYGF